MEKELSGTISHSNGVTYSIHDYGVVINFPGLGMIFLDTTMNQKGIDDATIRVSCASDYDKLAGIREDINFAKSTGKEILDAIKGTNNKRTGYSVSNVPVDDQGEG